MSAPNLTLQGFSNLKINSAIVVDAKGKLQPYFITVSNIESKDPQQVIEGNEKVVRPRLSDAEFFFLQDQKSMLLPSPEDP